MADRGTELAEHRAELGTRRRQRRNTQRLTIDDEAGDRGNRQDQSQD
jgi:hypothetical protein